MLLAEAKDCEIQQLQERVKELEKDCEQLEADKQQQMKETKCVAAEEGKRGAEEDRIRMVRELAEKDKILCDVLNEKDRLERKFEQYRISQEELVRDLTGKSQGDCVKVLCVCPVCMCMQLPPPRRTRSWLRPMQVRCAGSVDLHL